MCCVMVFSSAVMLIGMCSASAGAVVGKNTPRTLERYPFDDRPDFPMPGQIPPFAFPAGFKVSTSHKESVSFSFKLTDGTGVV